MLDRVSGSVVSCSLWSVSGPAFAAGTHIFTMTVCVSVFVGYRSPWLTKHIHSQMSWKMVLLSVKNDTHLTNLRLRAVERQSFTIHIARRLLEVQWWFTRVCLFNSHNTHQTPLPDREKELWNLYLPFMTRRHLWNPFFFLSLSEQVHKVGTTSSKVPELSYTTYCFDKSHLKSLIEKKWCIFYLGSPCVLCRGVGIIIEWMSPSNVSYTLHLLHHTVLQFAISSNYFNNSQ